MYLRTLARKLGFASPAQQLAVAKGDEGEAKFMPAIPEIFKRLLHAGRWVHPGDDVLRQIVPCIDDPLDFLDSIESILRESSGHLADIPHSSKLFKEVRGSRMAAPVELPFRDVEKSIFIAVNREIGADVAIALDFRNGAADPRVIASAWDEKSKEVNWIEVAPTFSEFLKRIGIAG